MAKKPTMITINPYVMEWIDLRVNERLFSSRSHAFERAVILLMSPEERKEVVQKMSNAKR